MKTNQIKLTSGIFAAVTIPAALTAQLCWDVDNRYGTMNQCPNTSSASSCAGYGGGNRSFDIYKCNFGSSFGYCYESPALGGYTFTCEFNPNNQECYEANISPYNENQISSIGGTCC